MAACLWAQGISDNRSSNLPLRRVVVLTSGLSYYEHSGSVNGSVSFNLPFRLDAVNDALRTLVINDPSSTNPQVVYQSENTLIETLRSLSIDLSDEPGMAAILSRLRGAQVEIHAPTSYTGRIAGIEHRHITTGMMSMMTPFLLLSAQDGLRAFDLNEIASIRFTDPVIEQDLNRALDLIAQSRNSFSRQLMVSLGGSGRRNVSISYVIPSPVWKVSYRLDLGASSPLFQGWAIVDNDSDNDWNNVELSLVAGRPASFIQQLYPPYYVSRPVLPLSIAGTAEGVTHDRSPLPSAAPAAARMRTESSNDMAYAVEAEMSVARDSASIAGGTIQTAAARDSGGQFEFTIRNPVTLNRRMSAMFPIVESQIQARAVLIYNGSGRYPRLGAELTNTSGMKLPAGPITVYDGGVYAGDALIDFWNENENRFISYGEDLSVTANITNANATVISSVRISGGVMIINRNITYTKTYTFINSGSASRPLIVEHSRMAQTDLVSPEAFEETASLYRFNTALPANRQTVFSVNERRTISSNITLLPMNLDTMISYSTNQEIPANVREALARAVTLRRAVDAAEAETRTIDAQRTRLITEQDRIRRNLEAAGQSQQGQEYLRRLAALDNEIDTVTANLARSEEDARAARRAYETYINSLNLS